MCSINFVYQELGEKRKLEAVMAGMVHATKYRGPDSSKIYADDKFGLGVNRLEIIGGPDGQQPIVNHNKSVFLLCNGEIFNYKVLKQKYFQKKDFTTTSDCEVILHLYEKFGENCVEYIEGQFAFVIFDLRRNQIFTARDPYGINPLFYYYDNKSVVIASEIKSIFASTLAETPTLDPYGIAETFFFYGAIPPRTCFQDIKQLPPGHVGIYDISAKIFNTKSYRKIGNDSSLKQINGEEARQKLRNLLSDSVKTRLQGGSVPGVYVSGGIDSAIIASYVNELSEKKPVAFGISFSDQKFDEGVYQELVAKTFEIPLIQIKVSTEDIIENIIDCIRHAETPLIRTAPVPMYLLSRAVSNEKIKFVLCGEGADELFCGYPVFLRGKASFEDKWADNKKYLNWFNNEIRLHIENCYKDLTCEQKPSTNTNLRLKEINTKLSQYLLTNQGDRMSMAHGVEQRFPYLDSRVSNFAFALDNDNLFDRDGGKAIIRNAFKDVLSKTIVERKKQGYLAPDVSVVSHIIQTDYHGDCFEEGVANNVGIFEFKKISQLIKQFYQHGELGEGDARMLFFVLTTHLLHQNAMQSN